MLWHLHIMCILSSSNRYKKIVGRGICCSSIFPHVCIFLGETLPVNGQHHGPPGLNWAERVAGRRFEDFLGRDAFGPAHLGLFGKNPQKGPSMGELAEGAVFCGPNVNNYRHSWLVVWNMNFIFHMLGIIIPTDFHIFQRGRYTTNQIQILIHALIFVTWGRLSRQVGTSSAPDSLGCLWLLDALMLVC